MIPRQVRKLKYNGRRLLIAFLNCYVIYHNGFIVGKHNDETCFKVRCPVNIFMVGKHKLGSRAVAGVDTGKHKLGARWRKSN